MNGRASFRLSAGPLKFSLPVIFAFALYAQPRAWQDTIALRTYPEGAPDAAPVLDALSPDRAWYPYATRNPVGGRPVQENWRRIHLENEYLACSFLPDVGGRLYTCIDKRNGHAMFYANPAIKKDYGTRGVWTDLGIEANFPYGHARDSSSPVDFAFRQEKDQAAVWMSDVDRVTGMRWTAQFVLRAGRAVLEENVTLANPTGVRQPYYWWNNAEIAAEPGSRFIIPAKVVATRGKADLDSWPVSSSGVDRSIVANVKDPLGLFAYECREPFLAVYHAGSRTGTVHVADPRVLPGKKIWTWGTNPNKGENALVDDGSHPIEIQAGLFANQETFEYLEPHASRTFTEYWLPARELDGISRATADAVLDFARSSPTSLAVELNVTRSIPGARIRVSNGNTPVLQETVNLDPAQTFARTISNADAGTAYRFELLDAQGKVLLAHTEGVYDSAPASSVKLGPQPKPPADTADGLERSGRLQFAENAYRAELAKSPNDAAIQKALGRLLAVRGNFADAAPLLAAAAGALPQDAAVRYYLALAQAAQNNEAEAQRNWQAIAGNREFGDAATLELAASLARSGRVQQGLNLVSTLLKSHPDLLEAGRLQVALLRKDGMTQEARAQLKHWRSVAPFDSFLGFEFLWLVGPDDALCRHLAADPGRALDLAQQYFHLGMYNEGMGPLGRIYGKVPANESEPGAVLPQDDPMAWYYRAFIHAKMRFKPAADYAEAAKLPVDLVFPYRTSSSAVLQAAVAANPSDASAHWLLGLLEMNSGRIDPAIAEWQKARSLPGHVAELRPLLADALRKLKHDDAGAQAVLKEAPKSSAPAQKQVAAARPATANPGAAPAPRGGTPATPSAVAALALMRAAAGEIGVASSLFTAHNFPQDHQPEDVRRAYIEIQLLKLRAAAAEQHCDAALHGVDTIGDEDKSLTFTMYGFGAFMKGARFQYYLAGVESACGEQKTARKTLTRTARMTAPVDSPDYAFPALSEAILNAAGGKPKMQAALDAVNAELAKAPAESKGMLLYSQGMLLRGLGQEAKAMAAFTEGAKAPDRDESQYLNMLAAHEAAR